jgi:predicted alpha/beta superfamily hydrolase
MSNAVAQVVPVPAGPEQVVIESQRLGERRPVLVYLPESYRHTQARYPVLIVVDGDGPGATLAMSVVNNLSALLTGSIPELIVVAIPNFDRSRDLVPPPANGGVTGDEGVPAVPNAHADVFLAFIEEELLPEIDRRYRTHPVRFLHGSSYGGLFGVFAFVKRPDLFRGIVASSPSLWVDKHAWVDSLSASLQRRPATQQWLYSSAGEFDSDLITTPMPRLTSVLRAGAPTTLSWRVESLTGRDHQSANEAALMAGLRHIFAGFQVPYLELGHMSPDDVRARYRALSTSYGWPVQAPAWAFNRQLLIQGAVGHPWQDKAEVAKAIADEYPWHPYGYDAQTWFYGVPGRDLPRAVALEEEAIRIARRSGYWVAELEAALAGYRKQLPK